MDVWKDLKFLNESYRNLIDNYFLNKSGKFKIENNILFVDFDLWGIEKFYVDLLDDMVSNLFYILIYIDTIKIHNIGISIQIGNWDTFKKMEVYLNNFKNINSNIYFVLINSIAMDEHIEYLKKTYLNCVILGGENRGMYICLFFINLHFIKKMKYVHDYIFKLHTKTNDDFRNQTLNILIPSHQRIIDNIRVLNKNNVGMYSGNAIYKFKEHKDAFNANYYHLRNLVQYLYGEEIDTNKLEFCAGTIFIVKTSIFNILNLKHIEYLYNSLNNIDTLDYYWYSIFYKLNINNKDIIHKDYINNKNTKQNSPGDKT